MNRQQVVEKTAAVIEDYLGDDLNHGDTAQRVLDAVLPQVSTVAELEALPEGAHLSDGPNLYRWRRYLSLLQDQATSYDYEPGDVLSQCPLTVVWQP